MYYYTIIWITPYVYICSSSLHKAMMIIIISSLFHGAPIGILFYSICRPLSTRTVYTYSPITCCRAFTHIVIGRSVRARVCVVCEHRSPRTVPRWCSVLRRRYERLNECSVVNDDRRDLCVYRRSFSPLFLYRTTRKSNSNFATLRRSVPLLAAAAVPTNPSKRFPRQQDVSGGLSKTLMWVPPAWTVTAWPYIIITCYLMKYYFIDVAHMEHHADKWRVFVCCVYTREPCFADFR